MNETKRCFEPVVDSRTRLLILGSLPSEQSLLKGEYYGNKQNKFWELTGAVIGVDLRALPYAARLDSLRAHGVGLWDVIAEAERPGSLDTAIRNARSNELLALASSLPALKAIAFNGGTAARQGRKLLLPLAERVALVALPSSSPAHTIGFERKCAEWLKLRLFL
jgi:hypoxanthine-DNA glycosylase